MSKKIKVSSNKSFGIVFFIFFLAVALYPLINQGEFRLWALITSLIFLILGLINSSVLTPLNLLWFKFGMLLGRIVSPIIMGLVFFCVVTPTGLIMKFFKKDLLKLKKNNNKSYWIERKNKSEMKNQF
jgi:polyferredoxin|tara:strand:+ start:284 stop:667 length:384 start_codon:yes stop_codon:yes gene_type:complete